MILPDEIWLISIQGNEDTGLTLGGIHAQREPQVLGRELQVDREDARAVELAAPALRSVAHERHGPGVHRKGLERRAAAPTLQFQATAKVAKPSVRSHSNHGRACPDLSRSVAQGHHDANLTERQTDPGRRGYRGARRHRRPAADLPAGQDDRDDTTTQIQEAEQEVDEANALLLQRQDMKDRAAQTDAAYLRLANSVPETPELPSLIIELQDVALQSGVNFEGLRPEDPISSTASRGFGQGGATAASTQRGGATERRATTSSSRWK